MFHYFRDKTYEKKFNFYFNLFKIISLSNNNKKCHYIYDLLSRLPNSYLHQV